MNEAINDILKKKVDIFYGDVMTAKQRLLEYFNQLPQECFATNQYFYIVFDEKGRCTINSDFYIINPDESHTQKYSRKVLSYVIEELNTSKRFDIEIVDQGYTIAIPALF